MSTALRPFTLVMLVAQGVASVSAQTPTSNNSPNAAATVIISQPTTASKGSGKSVTVGVTFAAIFGFLIVIGLGIYFGKRKRKAEDSWRRSMVLPVATARSEKGMSVVMTPGGGSRPSSMMTPKMRPGSSIGGGTGAGSSSGLNTPASSIGPAAANRLPAGLVAPNGNGIQRPLNPPSPLAGRQPLLPPSTPPAHPQIQLPLTNPPPTEQSQSQQEQSPLLYQHGPQSQSPSTPKIRPLPPTPSAAPNPPLPSIRVHDEETLPKEENSDEQQYPRHSASLDISPHETDTSMTYPPSSPGQPEEEPRPIVS
ncbi:hypothetical protein FRB97_006251 [Tulasnella sp. 331]|nr:hypothetical protein FRB97_006251 [Tulasnella sp. 331]KAG8888354.1 hypothetical protein FRB98_007928 [Tulasnella sp. 332]